MKIQAAGENALIVYFDDKPSAHTSARIQHACEALRQSLDDRLVDLTPSYTSLLVLFDLNKITTFEARSAVVEALRANEYDRPLNEGKLIELPVYYHQEVAPDLDRLAEHAGMSTPDVIALHQNTEYRVYAIGFAPGFAYLGEVDERIAIARLATPRLKVPKGAVAIADRQTAVYPATSPGGWHIIGRCPIEMFNPKADPPVPFSVGDRVCFRAVERDKFLNLGGSLEWPA